MGKKILIVEDDEYIASMYSDIFQKEGFKVLLMRNIKDTVETAKIENPDIVILDLMAGNISGFDILADIKKGESTKNIPVVILSNKSDKESIEKGKALGACDYLIKVLYTPNQVVSIVKKYIK